MKGKALILVGVLLASLLLVSPTSAHPNESQEFKNQHIGVDFPVGFADLSADGKTVRVVYPAMDEGEDELWPEMVRFHSQYFSVTKGRLRMTMA